MIEEFLTKMENTFRRNPYWLMSDNAGEYTSTILVEMLGDIDIKHVPIVPQNAEENGIAE